MIYLPELYYLQDNPSISFETAVEVTALTVSRTCAYYQAKLIAPTKKSISPVQQAGALPAEISEREAFVRKLVQWLLKNSNPPELFTLLLDDHPLPSNDQSAKFAHPDDTCCWVLNLSESEFAQLQTAWKANSLPVNLFYPQEQQICLPYPGQDWRARFFRAIGVRKCYTPQQWEQEKRSSSA